MQHVAELLVRHAPTLLGHLIRHPDAVAFLVHPSCDLHRAAHCRAENVEILDDRCIVFLVEPAHAEEILWAICAKKLPTVPPPLRRVVVLTESQAHCSVLGVEKRTVNDPGLKSGACAWAR